MFFLERSPKLCETNEVTAVAKEPRKNIRAHAAGTEIWDSWQPLEIEAAVLATLSMGAYFAQKKVGYDSYVICDQALNYLQAPTP